MPPSWPLFQLKSRLSLQSMSIFLAESGCIPPVGAEANRLDAVRRRMSDPSTVPVARRRCFFGEEFYKELGNWRQLGNLCRFIFLVWGICVGSFFSCGELVSVYLS